MESATIRRVVGATLAGALVLGAHVPASSARAGTNHIEVLDVEGPFERDIDLGATGVPTSGDIILESQPLLDPAVGSTVGRVVGQLTIVRPVAKGQDFETVLSSSIRLADGDLVLDGAIRFSELFGGGTLAVVGGTGAYDGARGTATTTAGTVAGNDGVLLSIDFTT